MDRPARTLPLSLLTLALLLLGAILPFPDRLRVASAIALIVLGFPIAILGVRPPSLSNDARGAGRAIGFGLLVGMVPAALLTCLGLFGVSLSALMTVYLAALGMTLLVGAGRPGTPAIPAGTPVQLRAVMWLLPLLVVATLLASFHGTPLGATDDSFDHLASLRHVIVSGRVEFPGAFYGLNDVSGSDPRKGIILTVLALAGHLTGIEAATVWRWSAIVLTPVMLLCIASLSLVVFGRAYAGVAGAFALLMAWGDPLWLLRGAYGGHWGLAMSWAAMAVLLAGGGLLHGFIAGSVAAAVHAYSPAQAMVPLVCLLAVPAFRKDLRIAGLAGFILGAIPGEIVRIVLGGGGNPLHEQAMGWLMLPVGPVASPLQILAWYGYIGVAAGGCVLALSLRPDDRAGRFLRISFLSPLLLLLNPFLFERTASVLGSVANKVALVWIHPLALVWIAGECVSRRGAQRAVALIGAGLLAALLAMTIPGRIAAWRAGDELSPSLTRAMTIVRDGTPVQAVVASDPMTSYAIPALTGRRAIVSLHQHAPPGDTRALERLAIAAALYSECVPVDEALLRVRKEGATYLLSTGPGERRLDQFGNHVDPRNHAPLHARFTSRPDLLEPVAESGGSILFRILPDRSGSDAAAPINMDSSFTRTAAEAAHDTTVDSGTAADSTGRRGGEGAPGRHMVTDGMITLAITGSLPSDCERGQRLVLPVAWRRERPMDSYVEYFGHLRFENEAHLPKEGPLRGFHKPLRRLVLEPMSGGSHRWRTVEMPFRGLCPPAEWPPGVWLSDSMDVVVPPQLLPGRYRVRMSVEEGTLYPRLTPADLLSDEDRFSGPVIGSILIR